MLQIHSLYVSYTHRPVLFDINLSLSGGMILAVIGPNGSGKTTLIRAASGVQSIQKGQIRVMGQDLEKLSSLERARRIAVVPQALNMPPAFTGWETVLLGRTPHLNWLGQISEKDEEIARSAMQRTNSLQLAERYMGELSGGEQQRLMLARALAQEAPILLMDEPTAHLDLQYQVVLLEQIRRLAHQENLAVLIAMHDLNLVARYADRVALLENGSIRSQGKPEEVLTAESLSGVYGVHLQVIHPEHTKSPVIFPSDS
jgi:ABC-type cobalamin/Fe3+-siderophores transport system ATPase subunit